MRNVGESKTWEGRLVSGKFPLRQWGGGSEHSAVFLTDRPGQGQASQKAAIKLIAADADADRQLARWRTGAQLSHPHLIRIFEFGRCDFGTIALLYVVMEYAGEDLSQILPQRGLAPAEVADMLPPLLDALCYVHGKGLVHSRIKPSNVLAVGDQLKLSADQILSAAESGSARRRDVCDAPETAAGIISPAGDVWSVGVTLVIAVTQNVSFAGEASAGHPNLPQTIPEPFRGIARECLHLDPKRRCSIAEIQARLQPAARSVPAEPPTPPPQRPAVNYRPSVAALLVVAAIIGFVIFRHRGKEAPIPTADTQQAAPQLSAKPSPEPALQAASKLAPRSREVAADLKDVPRNRGEIVRQVLPEPSRSAKNTIQGTIRVSVRVDVDPAGKVTVAKLTSPGPSKYFARLALNAAQRWEFSPQEVGRKVTGSAWLLHFRFKRSSTQVAPERVNR
jgi:TonB family protein